LCNYYVLYILAKNKDMKIAFSASPKAKQDNNQSLLTIYETIIDLGHIHTDDLIKRVEPSDFYKPNSEEASSFFNNIERSIKAADICVFETSVPSLGLGHVIYMAISQGKPVIALYKGNNIPMLLSELDDPRVQVISYTDANLKKVLEDALNFAKDQADARFNFFISPSHANYLDWVAKNRRIPRSVYLRSLIKRDMEENKDYH
jgi:hypothetical protein